MERWATFDCYGTLIDWADGMHRLLEPFAGDRTTALLGSYYRLEPAVCARRPHLAYRDVLAETLAQAAHEQGIKVPARDLLADGWGQLHPFDDTLRELTGLRQSGWKIAILTNCDRDLFAVSEAQLGGLVDLAVTAQDVQSYKPEMRHFHAFVERTGATPANWVHVANSWMADIVAAFRLGVPSVWIDRDHSGHDATLANLHQHDLTNLAAAVDGVQGRGRNDG